MKLSPDYTFPLIALMTELFTFITARPTNTPQGKRGLQALCQDMRMLQKIAYQGLQRNQKPDFDQSITSLPSLEYKMSDLKTLEVNSTLEKLYSGLKSFKFHLDWLKPKQEEMGTDNKRTKELAHRIEAISRTVLIEMEEKPSELVYPSLEPLDTAWSMYQADVEILDKLYFFSLWSTRALGELAHRQQ